MSDTIIVPSTQTQSEVNGSLPVGPESAVNMEDMEEHFLNLNYSPSQERRADATGGSNSLEEVS